MTTKLPPLNALRAFEAAARTGSFKGAAEALNVSQSAVSHQIKRLEETLELELFHRHPRAVELTEAGREYFPFVEQAFGRIAEGTRLISQRLRNDILIVQTYSTFAVRWLLPRLTDFYRQHDGIQVRLITSQWDANFAEQDIDIAIAIGAPTAPDLHSHYLFSPRLFPVCSPRLLDGAKPLERPEDLAEHTILQVYPSENDWRIWLERNGLQHIDPDAGLSFDSYDHALKTAVRGMGVSLGMHPYVSEDFAAGMLVGLFPEHDVPAAGSWHIVYPEARGHLVKISAFRTWLIGQIMDDPDLAALRREDIT
jgi:LysR family glycine cleavage system transcriptional activator